MYILDKKMWPQIVEVSNLISSMQIGQLIYKLIFCGFNIHIFIFILNPTLDNFVKIQQFFIFNIMCHLETYKKNSKKNIPIIEFLNQVKKKKNQ